MQRDPAVVRRDLWSMHSVVALAAAAEPFAAAAEPAAAAQPAAQPADLVAAAAAHGVEVAGGASCRLQGLPPPHRRRA
eukprot:scaffold51876_cov87-Phaeocystis_antarctica.AAC.1